MASSTESPARFLVTARVWLDHSRGMEPSEEEVAKAVADRLGDGEYLIAVNRGKEFGSGHLIPTASEAEKARRID